MNDQRSWEGAAHEYEEQARFARAERDKALENLDSAIDTIGQLKAEVARLTAALAEANDKIMEYQGIVEASPAVQKAMGHYYDKLREVREAKAREEERELHASLWPPMPSPNSAEFGAGWVAAVRAFRAAIRARSQS